MNYSQYKMPKRLTTEEYMQPATYFNISKAKLECRYPLHWHEFYEIEFIAEGEGEHCINGVNYPLMKGTLFLLTPADFHEIIANNGSVLSIINLKFSDEMINDELRSLLFSDSSVNHIQLGEIDFLRVNSDLNRLLDEYINPGTGSHILIHGGLERIFIEMIRSKESVPKHPDNSGDKMNVVLQKALIYIHHHFRESLSLEDIAKKCHLSPNYFSECFHQAIGITFQSYLQKNRLDFSKSLLTMTNMTVTEICFASGFNSAPYFVRTFKKVFGQSPNFFRKNNKENK